MKKRRITILGSTGSVGTQTLDVVRALPDLFEVVGLAAGTNIELLREQIRSFDVKYAACSSPGADLGPAIRVDMNELASMCDADILVVATSSTAALTATLAALERGCTVATANKEVLVAAGELVVATAARSGAKLLPIDSEHNAIWQCLRGEAGGGMSVGTTVDRVILTASGGALRDMPLEDLPGVTPSQALQHPVWRMGSKVTIDAATLVNKAFEVIEAHWLFDLPFDKIDVLVHRESVVHSIVQFVDGSSKAQLGLPDMRLPIQYALTYPDRVSGPVQQVDLARAGTLTFANVDQSRYPAFEIVLTAARQGGTASAAMSAANDVVVEAFLRNEIRYGQIARLLERVLSAHTNVPHPGLEEILAAERWSRHFVSELIGRSASKTPQ